MTAVTGVGSAGPTAHRAGVLLADRQPASAPPSPAGKVRPRSERHPSWYQQGRATCSVPARAGIFGLTALLYTWNLSHIGMGNTFYAAAVKSGTESWKAFFFGAFDPGSFITVDKPPVALWVMELSGRIFGFSSWSMLLPQALAGLATVMVLYNLVRRWFGEPAAALSSLAVALTPVAVVIFRFDNPDAILTLLLVLAMWAFWRAIETARTLWLVLSGALVGLAFLTKSLDAFIVVPALGLTYLWCGPPRLGRRIGQLGWAALAVLVSSGWWVTIVELWPNGARPYIGGSTDNSELNLIFGYNGLARVSGSGAAWSGTVFGGPEGLGRMFDRQLGGQISWLLPLAIVGLVGGCCLTRGRERIDREWGGFVLWGATLLTYFAVYDDARGIFHPYYTVLMAPAVAALAGAGTIALWRLGRQRLRWAWVLPASIVGTVVWADALLARASGYDTWVGPTVVVTGVASAALLFVHMVRPHGVSWLALVAGAVATASVLAGPAAYALTTVGNVTDITAVAGPTAGATRLWDGNAQVSQRLIDYLERHQGSAKYMVAVYGSEEATPFILESGRPVIAMGGFTGSDPAPTLREFKHLVETGKVYSVYDPWSLRGAGGSTGAVAAWVENHGTIVSSGAYGGGSGGGTLYDVGSSAAAG